MESLRAIIDAYEQKMAAGRWKEAEELALRAIESCPIHQFLPVLTRMRLLARQAEEAERTVWERLAASFGLGRPRGGERMR